MSDQGRPAICSPPGRAVPRVAFVLGSGCNLGAVQVGQLRALLEHGITADLVVGCSVGALNGAAFAEQPTLSGVAGLERLWRQMNSGALMPRRRLPRSVGLLAALRRGQSIYPNEGLRQAVERHLAARAFEDLSVAFECVATDAAQRNEVWFDSGSELVDAILASAALPAMFPPVEIAGRWYIDGGVVNDVPVQRAVDRGASVIYVLPTGSFDAPWCVPRTPRESWASATAVARWHRWQRALAGVPAGVALHVLPHGIPDGELPVAPQDFSRSDELMAAACRATSLFLAARPGAARPQDALVEVSAR